MENTEIEQREEIREKCFEEIEATRNDFKLTAIFGKRERYELNKAVKGYKSITVDIFPVCCDLRDKNCLMNLWKKHGYMKEALPNYWAMDVYATEENGDCWGRFNPTERGQKVNFSRIVPCSIKNRELLLAKCQQLAERDQREIEEEPEQY